jgi:two-component system response regulator YesN
MKIVIVDDEPIICEGIAKMLSSREEHNFEVFAIYYDSEEALEICNWSVVDVLLLDISMPGLNGLEMLRLLRERGFNVLVIIISAYAQFEYARQAMISNAVDFITKPISIPRLLDAIHTAEHILANKEGEEKKRLLVEENVDKLRSEYLKNMILGTENYTKAQQHELEPVFGLTEKSYEMMLVLVSKNNADVGNAVSLLNDSYQGSFYCFPVGQGITIILAVLSDSMRFDPVAYMNSLEASVNDIQWFGHMSVYSAELLLIAYVRLFKQLVDSGCLSSIRTESKTNDSFDFSSIIRNRNRYSLAVLQVLDIIDDDYAKPLSLTILSQRVGVHPTYLSNLFKKQIGLTLVEYLNHYRIEKAKEMLQDPLNKIFWISEQVGFANQRYFSQVFKRISGLTPEEYRIDSFLTDKQRSK